MYSIDTNIYLDWSVRRYPADLFPTFTTKIEQLIGDGKWKAVKQVEYEIGHVGTKELKAWAKKQRHQFVPHDSSILAEATAITSKFPGLIDIDAQHDEADRYIIALAKINGWTVVTHETLARNKKNPPRSHYIPDVCEALAIPCIDLLELMRQEKWTFS